MFVKGIYIYSTLLFWLVSVEDEVPNVESQNA